MEKGEREKKGIGWRGCASAFIPFWFRVEGGGGNNDNDDDDEYQMIESGDFANPHLNVTRIRLVIFHPQNEKLRLVSSPT